MRRPGLEALLESPLRVVLMVGLIVGAPVIGLGQASDADARSRLAADEARLTVETAERAADLIATQIATLSVQVRGAAVSDISLAIDRGDVQSLDALLRQFKILMGVDVRRLFATDLRGRVLASAPRDDQLTSVAERDYFTALTGGGPARRSVISAVYRLDTADAQPGFAIANPVASGSSTIGMVVGEVDLQYLPSRLAAFRSSAEDLYVIDGSGQLVGQAAVAAVGRANPNLYRQLRDDSVVRTLVAGRATDGADPLGRGRRLLAAALIRDTPWQVIAVRDPSFVERETDAALRQLAILRLVLVTVVLLGTYVLARATRRVATQRKALAESNARIAETNLQLAHASLVKSQFLSNMSHELRTPLNAIIGFADVLAARMFGELNQKQTEYVQDIVGSGRHLLALINDILDLSKVEAGRMELEPSEFALGETVRGALGFVRERAAGHRIELAADVPDDLGTVIADERKIRQVLLNLLSNAVKFTPDGGRVGVDARRIGGDIQVSVRDTGIGIAPDDQAKVFEEFQQVGGHSDSSREGTGLGLTLAKRFIELHGGRIWLESEVGKGTTFTFAIPVAGAQAAPA